MGSHRQDGRDDVTMKVVVIVLSMSVIATAFTIDDPRLPLRRQSRHPSLFSELLDYGFLDIFQDPNEVYSGTTQEPEFGFEVNQARTKREPGLLDGLVDLFKDPNDASTSYSAPESTYDPPSSYEIPQATSYKEPEPSYEVPEASYDAPETYEVPQATSYVVPQSPNYAAPEPTYKEPEPSYNEPEEPILAINIGVGNEAIIARKKREPGLLDGLVDLFKDPSDASSSYEVPESTYDAPSSYEIPQATSYVAPESYEIPQATSYQAPPEPSYVAPETYEVPQAPESSYNEPSYQAPASETDSLLSISIESSQRSS